MANFHGLSLPAYGIGYHYDTDQTLNLTIENDGRFTFAMSSTGSGSLLGVTLATTSGLSSFLGVTGTKGPTYFLSVGPSSGGAAQAVGFWEVAHRFTAAPSTTTVLGTFKVLAGSKAYYMLGVPDTTLT